MVKPANRPIPSTRTTDDYRTTAELNNGQPRFEKTMLAAGVVTRYAIFFSGFGIVKL
jgi:hypothetical protein